MEFIVEFGFRLIMFALFDSNDFTYPLHSRIGKSFLLSCVIYFVCIICHHNFIKDFF